MPRLIGYGICGAGESDRYLNKALDSFQICDDVIICLNNATDKEKKAINSRGYRIVEDNREWGLYQWQIKQNFVDKHIRKLEPDWLLALDMDEELMATKEDILNYSIFGDALQVYVVNLWGDGYRKDRSFWNARIWRWTGDINFEKKALHCGLVPKWAWQYGVYSPLMLIHYGLKDKESRVKKIERYRKYDPKHKYLGGDYYQSLSTDNYDKLDLGILQNELLEYFNNYKPIKKKEFKFMEEKKLLALKRFDGLLIRIPEDQLTEHLTRKQNNGQPMFELITPTKPVEKSEVGSGLAPDEPVKGSGFICETCGYEAKSKVGLVAHTRRHK